RAEAEYCLGVVQDIFDSEHYLRMHQKVIDETTGYCAFDSPDDLPLGLATDRASIFKQRRHGQSTAMPIILINYTLHPSICTHLENVICVGVIPSPKQCKDLNSFLIPLVKELLELEEGIRVLKVPPHDNNEDPAADHAAEPATAPAVAPTTAPTAAPATAPTADDQDFGVNLRPVFTRLKSINLAACAPYDAMHLLFKNLVPNLIRLWTGKFKGLDQGTGNYELDPDNWVVIGQLTAQATKIIPLEFVSTLPDIAQDRYLYTAEGYAFWVQYLAPILLEGQLANPYYKHFLLMCEIIILALQFELTYDDLDRLQDMINTWVVQYEEYYYQHDASCLPVCPLMIHALLHLPYYIRTSGPLWASWAFVMERFCGHIIPAVKNRTRPYEHLNAYVQRRAQMQAVSLKYNLPSLAKPRINYTYAYGERFSSHERMYPECTPIRYDVDVNAETEDHGNLMNQLAIYFGTVYGRFRLTGNGDRFHTAGLITRNQEARDNLFVRYEILPDTNASLPDAPDVPIWQVYYGQLLNIYYIEFITDIENDVHKPFLLARVRECQTGGLDVARPENPLVTYRQTSRPYIIHLDTITYVIGRVQITYKTWAIIDRSTSGARTQFVDANGEPEDFD
ncbi:hypothetical protein FRC11_010871, partial [Ceratobasidium sp. 423]